MAFNGFKKEGLDFLRTLQENNNKIWFENHRHIWEKNILQPNIDFVEEMGDTLQILVPTINAKAKVSGSLFKIYRDVRFSKDKTPMKDKIGILFWQGKSHRMSSSSFYFFFNCHTYYIAAGIRVFKTPLLKAYREYIKTEANRIVLHNILEDLKAKGYDLPEVKYKRYPLGFKEEDKYSYLALFDTIKASKDFEFDETFFSIKIVDKAFKIYEELFPLQQWLYELTLKVEES